MQLYLSVVECFENICNDGVRLWSQDSLTDARGLILVITTTDFVSALVITNSCLKYLKAVTASLQAEAKDIVTAVSEIDIVTAALQDVRDNINTPYCSVVQDYYRDALRSWHRTFCTKEM